MCKNGKLLVINMFNIFINIFNYSIKLNFEKTAFSTGFFPSKHEWTWDEKCSTSSTKLSNNNLSVTFHPVYSTGTAVVKGNKPLEKGRHHFWEIVMVTHVYGTDVVSFPLIGCILKLFYTFNK